MTLLWASALLAGNIVLFMVGAWLVLIPILALHMGPDKPAPPNPAPQPDSKPRHEKKPILEEEEESVPTVVDSSRPYALYASIAILLASFGYYVTSGFSWWFFLGWLSGIVLLSLHMRRYRRRQTNIAPALEPADNKFILALALVFGVIYLSFPFSYPWQMNTDEIIIRDQIRDMCFKQPGINILGTSTYFAFPAFVHVLFGTLANLQGGITVEHLRTVHATFGVAAVVCSFLFFRSLLLERKLALPATLLFGLNHSFLSISRLVSQNTTSPLVEVVSLAVLFRGMLRKCPYLLYLGGAAAGLSWYIHPPARVIFFLFMLAYLLNRWAFRSWKSWAKSLIPVLIGFFLVTFPMLWSIHLTPKENFEYQRGQFLFLPEGRQVQMVQVWAPTEFDGVMTNIRQGLLAFNYPIHDHSNIYINDGYGFVDPITGIMIWIGIAYLLFSWYRRIEHRQADILCIGSFISLWLMFAFVITFAPSFTRMTIFLPFVAYLAVHGLVGTSRLLTAGAMKLRAFGVTRGTRRSKFESGCFATILAVMIVLNLQSIWKFYHDSITVGDIVSSTYRHIEKLLPRPNWNVVLACDEDKYKYFDWGDDGQWWGFADRNDLQDRLIVISPQKLMTQMSKGSEDRHFTPPFTLFLNAPLWQKVQADFAKRHANYTVEKMMPDGSRLSITVAPQ